jgi:hypothetical protein
MDNAAIETARISDEEITELLRSLSPFRVSPIVKAMEGLVRCSASITALKADNARLQARVSELEAAQEWQSIESAPRNEKDGDARVSLPIQECPKCGAKAVAFICSRDGCPVNGGAAHRPNDFRPLPAPPVGDR